MDLGFRRDSPYLSRCILSEGIVNPEHTGCEAWDGEPDDPTSAKPCKCFNERPTAHPACPLGPTRRTWVHSSPATHEMRVVHSD